MVSRLLALLLVLCLAAFAVPAFAAKDIEILFWEQEDPEGLVVFDQLIAEFMKANPGITVKREHYQTEDLRTNFQTAALANSGPHIVFGPNDNIGPFATMGIIQPLDKILRKEYLATFLPSALEGNKFQGKLWAIPDRIGNHLTLVYNKKMVPTPPKDSDELIRIAKQFTKDLNGDGMPDQYGLVYNLTEPFWFPPFLGGFGGWVMDENGKPTLNTPACVKALKFIQDLKLVHKVVPQQCDYELADTLFKEGKAAMIINGPWSWTAYKSAGIDIGLARIPMIKETGIWPTPMTGMKGYSISSIVKPGPQMDAVVKFLEFMTSKQAQLRLVKAVGQLPTNIEANKAPEIVSDPMLKDSSLQMQAGKPMPIVPQMRAIWDAMRGPIEMVLAGSMTPEQGAKAMQDKALQLIAEMGL